MIYAVWGRTPRAIPCVLFYVRSNTLDRAERLAESELESRKPFYGTVSDVRLVPMNEEDIVRALNDVGYPK